MYWISDHIAVKALDVAALVRRFPNTKRSLPLIAFAAVRASPVLNGEVQLARAGVKIYALDKIRDSSNLAQV